MPSAVDRFHSLSDAYQGFFASPLEDLKQITYTPAKNQSNPVLLPTAHSVSRVQADIGETAVPVQELQNPPYRPVMSAESARTPLGGPTLTAVSSGTANNSRSSDTVVLSKLEFAVLCALAGAGVALLVVHLQTAAVTHS